MNDTSGEIDLIDVATTPASPDAPHKLRVAVVDDDPAIRSLLSIEVQLDDRLELVAAVPDGETAIELLDRSDIDAMVLDMHMGLLTGPMVLMAARARRPELRVIAYSADSALLHAAARSGATATFRKGDDVALLLDAIVA
jgi:DNA-binding NtrC family response regulator